MGVTAGTVNTVSHCSFQALVTPSNNSEELGQTPP